jgi:hypothetical protein
VIQCDDTEFVTLGDRTVVSLSSRYKGIFTGNKLSFALPFMFRVSFHNASPRERTVLVPFPHKGKPRKDARRGRCHPLE